ncbi:MAG: VWA domain-containing protein [Spirochaetia bacterium]|nr:VWA domain-containing protein [Spirochaetia bacterium]
MKKTAEKTMDVVFILDRSGSMGGSEADTIGGFNSYLKKNKKKDYLMTTILFDDRYEKLYERKKISEVEELDEETYFVRGSTALLDAVGKSIKLMEKKAKGKVMFVITTDGYENSSHEFKKEQIKEMIEGHKEWEFMYIGADVDSYSEASSIGISASHTANYRKSKKGISVMYDAVGTACECCLKEMSLDDSWKKKLDNYIKENEE